MRITNNMMISNMMTNVNKNLQGLSKVQDKMQTGKKFQLPSDDPIGVSKSLKYHTDLSRIEQYKRNVDDATSWMEVTESAVSQIGDILERARELTVQAANDGTNTGEDKEKVSAEIKQLREQIIKVANTKHAGRAIFSGYKTADDLIDSDGNYNIDLNTDEKTKYNVGSADTIDVNVVGTELFGLSNNGYKQDVSKGDTPEMIRVFDKLIQGLDSDDVTSIDESITEIDETVSNVLSVRAKIGAKTNRLELNKNRLEDQTLSVTKLLSKNEDVDIAEVVIELKTRETVYQASLHAGARIIQPSLIDFLR